MSDPTKYILSQPNATPITTMAGRQEATMKYVLDSIPEDALYAKNDPAFQEMVKRYMIGGPNMISSEEHQKIKAAVEHGVLPANLEWKAWEDVFPTPEDKAAFTGQKITAIQGAEQIGKKIVDDFADKATPDKPGAIQKALDDLTTDPNFFGINAMALAKLTAKGTEAGFEAAGFEPGTSMRHPESFINWNDPQDRESFSKANVGDKFRYLIGTLGGYAETFVKMAVEMPTKGMVDLIEGGKPEDGTVEKPGQATARVFQNTMSFLQPVADWSIMLGLDVTNPPGSAGHKAALDRFYENPLLYTTIAVGGIKGVAKRVYGADLKPEGVVKAEREAAAKKVEQEAAKAAEKPAETPKAAEPAPAPEVPPADATTTRPLQETFNPAEESQRFEQTASAEPPGETGNRAIDLSRDIAHNKTGVEIAQQAVDVARKNGDKVLEARFLKDLEDRQAKVTVAETELETLKAEMRKQPEPAMTLGFMGMSPDVAKKLGENVVAGMKSVSAATSQIIESAKTPPQLTKGIDAMIEHNRNIRRSESTAALLEKTVNDIVPSGDRQMLMTHAIEQKMKGPYWDQLTEIEKGVTRWLDEEKQKLNQYVKDNEVLDMMPESEDITHIYHHWINPETGKPYQAMYGKFSKGLPQAKQRTIPTYEAGISEGMTPATTNPGKLIGLEWQSVMRANNARQLFKTLHGVKGDPGTSIILSEGGNPQPIRAVERWDKLAKQGLTDDYIRYDSPFLDKSMTFAAADGRFVTFKGAVGVKKELYPFVRSYIEQPTYGKFSELNFVTKNLRLTLSAFHMVSLGMQEAANIRMPFTHIPKGIALAKELGPTVQLLHQEGLDVLGGYEDIGVLAGKTFAGEGTISRVANTATVPLRAINKFIFHYVRTGMKTSMADMLLNKLMPKYLEGTGWTKEDVMAAYSEGKPIPDKALQCAREVVQKVDGHFSGEHGQRALLETNRFMIKLWFTPEARKFWQTILLAPTWQREHLLTAKNVIKSFMPDPLIEKLGMRPMGPIKSQYRRYALGGLMMVGAVDAWNYMATEMMDGKGKHLWQNPGGKGFAVRAWWDEPDYETTDKDGNKRIVKGGPAYIRPLKSLFEVAEWAHDPFAKVAGKLSPMVSAIGNQLFGAKKYEGLPDMPKRTWDFVTDVTTPIVVDQVIETAQGKQSPWAAMFPFIGMPVSHIAKPPTLDELNKQLIAATNTVSLPIKDDKGQKTQENAEKRIKELEAQIKEMEDSQRPPSQEELDALKQTYNTGGRLP